MISILEKLRRPGASAADLKAKLAEVESAIPAAERAQASAEARRSAGLLELPDAPLEKIEAEAARARRDFDRLRAAEEELRRRIANAEANEAKAELDRERAETEKRAAVLAARLRPEYERHGAALFNLLTELAETEEAVRAINRKLMEAGRADTVKAVEPRAIDPGRNLPDAVSLLALVSLRPLGACLGWGLALTTCGRLGLNR